MDKILADKYKAGVDYLDENFAYFLTHVLNIGTPKDNRLIPTAAVSVQIKTKTKDISKDFDFLFNPDFADSLSTEDMAFIMGHETMHILLNHLHLAKKFKDPMRFNVAADCCINDYMVSMGLEPPENVLRGENVVGYNCANSTVSDIYNDVKMPEQPGGGGGESDGEGDGEGDGRGDGAYGGYADSGASIDDHGWIHGSSQEEADAADAQGKSMPKDLDDKKAKDNDTHRGWSPYGVGGPGAFAEQKGVGLRWAELLEKVNPFTFKKGPRPRPAWHRKPRKLGGFEGIYLPVKKEGIRDKGGDTPAIVMALDTSGSIGQEQANQFVNLARSVPQKKIKLFVCTFTSVYQELDLEDPQWNSGGTCFSAIEDYIREKVQPDLKGKRYPKAVVVITDGYATFSRSKPDKSEEDAWYWLITHDGDANYYGGTLPGIIDQLDKYVK